MEQPALDLRKYRCYGEEEEEGKWFEDELKVRMKEDLESVKGWIEIYSNESAKFSEEEKSKLLKKYIRKDKPKFNIYPARSSENGRVKWRSIRESDVGRLRLIPKSMKIPWEVAGKLRTYRSALLRDLEKERKEEERLAKLVRESDAIQTFRHRVEGEGDEGVESVLFGKEDDPRRVRRLKGVKGGVQALRSREFSQVEVEFMDDAIEKSSANHETRVIKVQKQGDYKKEAQKFASMLNEEESKELTVESERMELRDLVDREKQRYEDNQMISKIMYGISEGEELYDLDKDF